MANPEHVKLVLQRENLNRWRAENPEIRLDLSIANLMGADLTEANLSGADLGGANLRGASLREAELCSAYLHGANLREANFREADLIGADLSAAKLCGADLFHVNLREAVLRVAQLQGANLREAGLSAANLNGANLREADLTGATLQDTIFGRADLRDAKGLAACQFLGPCTLDHRTVQKSGGLPLAFLRGCGWPDSLIEYLPSLLNKAIQFFSCFISYSTKDQDFADRLYADLQSNGVRCWFASQDIQGGRKVHEQIDDAIRVYDKLLLILSDASMNSNWVKTEIANARAREEQQKCRMLFPITLVPFDAIRSWKLFDADAGIDSAREIREYFIPNFSNWKDHDSYKKAFDRLIGDLKV